MSKIIKITPEHFDEIRKDFEIALRNVKAVDGKVNYTKSFGYIDRKAVLYFTEKAWIKMQALIREFNKEVAWHGIAYRGEDISKDDYYITDILVYPQEVTGATVNTDQEKYEMWLMSQEDGVFNNIRMQGHSHVNMGTAPSGVDITHQEKILDQLEDDMFYIFMIWNKRGDKTIKIYDLGKNILFDTMDITVNVQDDGLGLSAFMEDAKQLVQDKKTTVQITTPSYQSNIGYGGYCSSYSQSDSSFCSKTPTDKKRKGKRKNRNQTGSNTAYEQQAMSWLDDEDDIARWYTK